MSRMNKNPPAEACSAEAEVSVKVRNPEADLSRAGESHQDRASECIGVDSIKHAMEVIASCGAKIGVVDRVEGTVIKLLRSEGPEGRPHFIPTNWVQYVDSQVHLKFNSEQTEEAWQSSAASCDSLGTAQH